MDDKEIFVKMLRYTTPMTVLILLYVGIEYFQNEIYAMAIIAILIIIEIFIALKAESIYEYSKE